MKWWSKHISMVMVITNAGRRNNAFNATKKSETAFEAQEAFVVRGEEAFP